MQVFPEQEMRALIFTMMVMHRSRRLYRCKWNQGHSVTLCKLRWLMD